MRFIIRPYFYLTGYRYNAYIPKSKNYLVLTNHNTNWDFFLAGLVIKRRHMYFVGSAHILQLPIVGPIIHFLSGLIPRRKGSSSDETVSLILQRLKEGENVCMMAEGNRSFDGKTCFISPKTAQLAKDAEVGLITLAIHGGYFVSPRWAMKRRHGPYYGKVVAEYSPEQIKEMCVDELYEHIKSDLYVNAYEDQKDLNASYKSSAAAEALEIALFACPVCGRFSSMHSKGDVFSCSCCNTAVRLNTRGYFEPIAGSDRVPEFSTILDWSSWQKDYLRKYLQSHTEDPDTPIFQDSGLTLSQTDGGNKPGESVKGALILFPDRFVFSGEGKEISVNLKRIKKISILLKNTLLFSTDDRYYQIKGKKYSALKYLIAQRFLVGKEYY